MRHTPVFAALALFAALTLSSFSGGCGGGGSSASGPTPTPTETAPPTVRAGRSVLITYAWPAIPQTTGSTDPDARPYIPRSAVSVRLSLTPLTVTGRTLEQTGFGIRGNAMISGELAPGRYRLVVTLHPQTEGRGNAVARGEQFIEIAPELGAGITNVPLPQLRSTVRSLRFSTDLPPMAPGPYYGPDPDPTVTSPFTIRPTSGSIARSLYVDARDAEGRPVVVHDDDWRVRTTNPAAVGLCTPFEGCAGDTHRGSAFRLVAPSGPASADIIATDVGSRVSATLRVDVQYAIPTTPAPPVPGATPTPTATPPSLP